MSVSRGPTRLMLLRSGGYDLAELPLEQPVHLVASNNVGKTTLIAALQFLYIDDVRQMHFSHAWADTKRHYFPHAGSLLLFECATPTGFQVFGLRGLGPVQGYDFERFAYNGPLERADYLDGQRLRPWDEVATRLLPKQYARLEPKHLRARLLASGDGKGPPLGLVPLKRSTSYPSFRFLFRNLLRLSRIDQDQLKRLLIDIQGPRLRRTDLDLRSQYGELHAKVERQVEDLRALQEQAPRISQLITLWGERQGLRGQLAVGWAQLLVALDDAKQATAAEEARLRAQRDATGAKRTEKRARQSELQQRLSEVQEALGRLKGDLEKLEALGEGVRGFQPRLEQATRDNLTRRRDALAARLHEAARGRAGDIEARIESLKRRLSQDHRLLENYEDAVITWLRAQAGLPDETISRLFRLLNPELLSLLIQADQVEIRDEALLRARLETLLGRFATGGFSDAALRISAAALGQFQATEGIEDVEQIRARLQRHEQELAQAQQSLADLQTRDALEAEKRKVEAELREAERRHERWQLWEVEKEGLPALRQTLRQRAVEAEELRAALEELAQALRALDQDLDRLGREQADLHQNLQQQVRRVQQLQAPPQHWERAQEPLEERGVLPLCRAYEGAHKEHERVARRFDRLYAEVGEQTRHRHEGGDEATTVAQLEDQLAALEDRRKAVEELWASLVSQLQSDFKALIDGVAELRRQLSALNGSLAQRKVSNLSALRLELVPQRDLLRKLEAVLKVEESPLLAGLFGGRDEATRAIARWLEEQPRIELTQLFDLRFRVTDRRGAEKVHDSLSRIESEGTSATIKVLVHLELLHAMRAGEEVRVPFFLDEVAALDDANLRGLVAHAQGLGFVPVLASPKATDCVDLLYFLRPSSGGLVLDERSRLILERGGDDDG